MPTRRTLHPTVILASLVSLLTDISSEMIVPILPLFLVGALRTPVVVIGVIEGVAEATAGLLKVYSGWLSDRIGRRKPLMLAGYGLSNLIKPVFALTTAWPQVLAIRFADRVGKGIRTAPRDALIADVTDPAVRGRAYGLHQALDRLGEAIGPLAAFAVLALTGDNYRLAFLGSAVPAALAMAVLALVRDPGRARAAAPATAVPPAAAPPLLSLRGLDRPLLVLIAVATLFALGNSSDAFLILRARELGMGARWVPLAYLTVKLAASLAAIPLGRLSDRAGRRGVLAGGYAVFGASYIGFALAGGPAAAWALFAVYGLYLAGTKGVERAFISDLAPGSRRGTALGAFAACTGAAALPASLLTGLLWERFGSGAALGASGALGLLAAVALLALVRPGPGGGRNASPPGAGAVPPGR